MNSLQFRLFSNWIEMEFYYISFSLSIVVEPWTPTPVQTWVIFHPDKPLFLWAV